MRHPSITASASGTTALPEGPFSLSTEHKEALLTFLEIPTELLSQDPQSLHTAYAKFKVLNNSSAQMGVLRSSQEWTDHLAELGVPYWVPIFVDLVNIFIAKTQFYSLWKPTFKRAQDYPEMIAWLDDDSDCESDSELWSETKRKDSYSFADLNKWLGRKDVAKGKKPAAKVAVKEKKKQDKRAVTSESSEEASEEKAVKAKAKAKAKKGKKKASE
jgi:hypothetical protein